jgi:hypothetical protein
VASGGEPGGGPGRGGAGAAAVARAGGAAPGHEPGRLAARGLRVRLRRLVARPGLLPSSPGYVGTFDYFASLALTAYGAPVAGAAAFAVVTHLMLWAPVTVAGFAALAAVRERSAPSADPGQTRLQAESRASA